MFYMWHKCLTKFCIVLSCILLISNSIISSAILEYTRTRLSMASKSTRPSDSCYFEVFNLETHSCMFLQIALEIMLLPQYANKPETKDVHGVRYGST